MADLKASKGYNIIKMRIDGKNRYFYQESHIIDTLILYLTPYKSIT